jgi:hypothetical protein
LLIKEKERTVRLPKVHLTLRSVRILAALLVSLAAGLLLFFMSSARNRSSPLRPSKSYIIMEGVDINSNGPWHLAPALPQSEHRFLWPPELQSGKRP